MGKGWVKIKCDLFEEPGLYHIKNVLEVTSEEVHAMLIRCANLFQKVGKYGVLKWDQSNLDHYIGVDGFCGCLLELGWMRENNGNLTLHYFTDVSATRKTLGAKVRKQILEGQVCRSCGVGGKLVIDHDVPISRGGGCETENLQPLCARCNIAKGTQTMEEFLASSYYSIVIKGELVGATQ